MPVVVKGFGQAEARIRAISTPSARSGMMRKAGLATVAEMKLRVPRKTGTTGRSIMLGQVTENSAEVMGSKVAVYLDTGTGLYGPLHHLIMPKKASVLAWKTGPSTRLSGRPRKGTPPGWVFARSVKGMKARPYISAALRAAAAKVPIALAAEVIQRWNDAA